MDAEKLATDELISRCALRINSDLAYGHWTGQRADHIKNILNDELGFIIARYWKAFYDQGSLNCEHRNK